MQRRLLAIYLNDHYAGAMVGVEVARRSRNSNRENEFGSFLEVLVEEVESDRRALRAVIEEQGIRVNRVKEAAAWVSEKLGRAKPNGRLTGYSPLSRLVELELLYLGVTGKLALWRALRDTPVAVRRVDLDELISRAERQRSEIERFRQRAAAEALGGDARPEDLDA